MKREAVDFFIVEDKHLAIHKRLENWARWSFSRTGNATSPMFRLYRATQDDADRDALAVSIQPVDPLDATAMQKAIGALPDDHRGALNWNYLRPSNPRRMAQKLGVSMGGLAQLVRNARQMLINRGA